MGFGNPALAPYNYYVATVELVYAPDCPNVELARTNLRLGFGLAMMAPEWTEHRIGDLQAPARTRGYGSPTVLVDGHDVAGLAPGPEACCRVYDGRGAPAPEQIAAALKVAFGEGG